MTFPWLVLIFASLISSSLLTPIEKADDDGDEKYLLPTIIKPEKYTINLKLEENFYTTKKFSGAVDITFYVEDGQTTQDIKLHARSLTFNSISLKKDDADIELNPGPYNSEEDTKILTLTTTAETLSGGGYVLSFAYEGVLSDTLMSGFYLSSYNIGDTVKYMATTQFEQDSARQAFPCFDEPSFKATFILSISYPEGYNAISNTPRDGDEADIDGLKNMKFKETPYMSTYLIAMVVSEYTCSDGSDAGGVPTEVCSREATRDDRDLAVELAPKVLDVMKTYTNFAFGDSQIGKMTQFAIPDFSAGAMENWGAVTYRERDILWNEDESSNRYKQGVVTVISHEFSHQWFGDLVTLKWWSDTFLNEGFATYFEYHTPDQIQDYSTWRLQEQFVVEMVQTALEADSSKSSSALHSPVFSPAQTNSRFDDISYNKGGSVLRMVHHLLKKENFLKGLQDYINANKFQNTEPANLWASLGKFANELPAELNFAEVMENWTNKPGFPVLSLTSKGNDITISQKRFLTTNDNDDTKWYVPITYTLSTDETADTTTKVWLTPNSDYVMTDVLKDVDWIVLNNEQTGLYRVNYDKTLMEKISKVLKSKTDLTKISAVQRAQIVDDSFALAKVGTQKYGTVLEQLQYLENEVDYIPWYSAFRGFDYLLKRSTDASTKKLITSLVLRLMNNLYKSVSFDAEKPYDHIYTLNQVQALTWACRLNEENCVKTAKALFAGYLSGDTPVPVSKNFKSIVYCNGLRYSDDIGKDFDALWTKYKEADLATEQVTILNGLGCATDDAVLQKYLNNIITKGSGIRLQDASAAFSSVFTANPEGVDSTLTFITTKHKEITDYFGSTSTLKSLIGSVTDRFYSKDQIDKLNAFATDHDAELADDVKTAIQNGAKTATDNLQWANDFNKQVKAYFDDADGGDDNAAGTVTLQISALFGTVILVIFQLL